MKIVETEKINAFKAQLEIPKNLWSCHTAELNGYVLEGHIPVAAIERMLAERPSIRGLAVPGMPAGSPGMEVEDQEPDTYEVMAFGTSGTQIYMRFKGSTPLPL